MSPFDTLKTTLIVPLIKSNPNASDNEIFRLAVRHFEKNESSRQLCYEYFLKNVLASVERVKPQGENSIAVLPRAKASAPAPAPVRAEVEHRVTTLQTRKAIVEEVKRVAPTAPAEVQKMVVADMAKRLDNPTIRTQIASEAARNIPANPHRMPAAREQAVVAAVAKAITAEVPKAVERVDRVEQMKTEAIACVLLNFVLPNGLQVRDATFGDMAVFGNWGLAVSKLGPANAKVGGLRGVSEEVLQNIMRRFTGEPLGAMHVAEFKSDVVANSSVEPPDHLRYAMMKPSDKPKWPCRGEIVRKHVSEKYCGGVTCMPGLSGKCVACADEE